MPTEPLQPQRNSWIRVKVFEPSNLEQNRWQRPHAIDDYYHPARYRFTTAHVSHVEVSEAGTTITCREAGRRVDSVFVDGTCTNFNGVFQAWIVAIDTHLTEDTFEPVAAPRHDSLP